MRRMSGWFVTVVFVLWLLSCRSPEKLRYATNILNQADEGTTPKAEIARIVGSEERDWRGSLTSIGEGEFFEFLQVTSDNVVYFLGEKNGVYSSGDGGVTWKSRKIKIPSRAFVSSLFFVDSKLGFASVVTSPTNVLDESGFRSSVLVTDDGGNTWQEQIKVNAAEIGKIIFDRQKVGWAVGRRLVRTDYLTSEPLLLTKSPEESWRELEAPEQFGSIENIYIDGDLTKTLIDAEGRMFQLNSNNEWKPIPGVNNIKRPQISISVIDVTRDNYFYLMGATGGREGAWTSLFTRATTSEDWKYLDLNNVILRDAEFLGSREVLACGSLLASDLEGNEPPQAVILRSLDGGRTWSVSYRTDQIGYFQDLLVLNEKTILAVGNGKLLRLERVP